MMYLYWISFRARLPPSLFTLFPTVTLVVVSVVVSVVVRVIVEMVR